jgi:hypothetical protein
MGLDLGSYRLDVPQSVGFAMVKLILEVFSDTRVWTIKFTKLI